MRRKDKGKCYFKFISPTGAIVTGINLTEFCEVNGLCYRAMKYLRQGTRKQHNGWHSFAPASLEHAKRPHHVYLVNVKTGERLSLNRSVKKIALEYKLTYRHLSQLINGKKLQYKGWVLNSTYNNIFKLEWEPSVPQLFI